MTLNDEDILSRLAAVEDGTTERKPYADSRGWVKTVVAFSNSLAIDQPGILFIGVNNNGTVQEQPTNFEDKQKAVTGEISNIYPPVNPTILVREKDGRKFIAVIVYGSRDRPHFAGKSYIRSGTQTIEASEDNLRQLIAQRSGKVAEILKWKNKSVVVNFLHPEEAHYRVGRVATSAVAIVQDCNEHWVTLKEERASVARSISLNRVTLAFDDQNNRLVIEVSSISV
jgi:predicted HTH transcriptional regulator